MGKMHRYLLAAAISGVLAHISAGASAQSSQNVTAVETVQLPRFCWAQVGVPDTSGDDFRIIDCGPAANHYCSSLIYIIRSKRQPNKNSRFNYLSSADIDLHYTEKAIAPYPNCSIRDHVRGTRAQLEELMKLYGYNRKRSNF
jgi:hypothetical protein